MRKYVGFMMHMEYKMKKCFVDGCDEEPSCKFCCSDRKLYCCALHIINHIKKAGIHKLQTLIVHLSDGEVSEILKEVNQLESGYDLLNSSLAN